MTNDIDSARSALEGGSFIRAMDALDSVYPEPPGAAASPRRLDELAEIARAVATQATGRLQRRAERYLSRLEEERPKIEKRWDQFSRENEIEAGIAAGVAEQIANVQLSTANDVPGHRVLAFHGEVYGLMVNSRGPFSDTAAKVRTAVGGEVKSYNKLMLETRAEVLIRLRKAAIATGANGVLAMRFDTTALTHELVEVVAYGTAVTIERDSGTADSE